jgi:hypothetical protein
VSRASIGLALVLLVSAGCGPSPERREQDRAEIERLLSDYAGRMSEAYRTGSAEALREVATERELARVHARIAELAEGGRMLRAESTSRRIESIEFNRTSAIATTAETWHLQVIAVGSETVLSESTEQENQVVYSLTRDRGRWWILSRILKVSSDD